MQVDWQSKVSAASYVIEPPACYADAGPPGSSVAVVDDGAGGEAFRIPGVDDILPAGRLAGAGAADWRAGPFDGVPFSSLPAYCSEPAARLEAMDHDGTAVQVLYPTVALAAYACSDGAIQQAVFDQYHAWIARFCAEEPTRLAAVYLTTARNPEQALADLEAARRRGFVGMVLPGMPPLGDSLRAASSSIVGASASSSVADVSELTTDVKDYVDPSWDPVWHRAAELQLPLTFHARASTEYPWAEHRSANPLYGYYNLTRNPQQLVGVFTTARIFERHPDLRVVTVEADASWMPHFAVRLVHYYDVHGPVWSTQRMARHPDEYLWDHVYLAFEDDPATFKMLRDLNTEHLLWCDLFPTRESDWPRSNDRARAALADVPDDVIAGYLGENCHQLYGLDGSNRVSPAVEVGGERR